MLYRIQGAGERQTEDTMNRATVTMLFLLAGGCGEDAPWVGQYAATGTWDISGPLKGDRTVGDAVADLLVEKIVGISGVPSALQDKAQELTSKAVRAHVKAVVDKHVPAELQAGGTVNKALAMSLTSARVESIITLEEGLLPGSMKGSESITAITYTHDGKSYRLEPRDLAGASVVAEWEGDEEGDDTLEVDPHGVPIQYGEVVKRVAGQVVDAAGLASLADKVSGAVSCDQIVKLILGSGTGLKVTVSEWSYTFAEADLKSACAGAGTLIQKRVLGMFALDTRLEVGGKVKWTPADGDQATSLGSGAGYGGTVNVAPRAIAPRVTVLFSATRQ